MIRTPEQVAEAEPLLSASWLRNRAREHSIAHVRGAKGRIGFTDEQVAAAIAFATQTPVAPKGVSSLVGRRAR